MPKSGPRAARGRREDAPLDSRCDAAASRFLARSRLHWIVVPAQLALTAALAITSLLGDSVTFDEPAHLTAGVSYLHTGDFRLSPEHPPLSRYWAALPVLFMNYRWPPPDDTDWRELNLFNFCRVWLFELNDGQRLVVAGRCMMVILLLATCLTVYALGRALWGPAAGLVAFAIAALSPELLAHGRLVTTDLPITLCFTLAILTFARLVQRFSWPRLVAASMALAAASLTKMSWPLVLPALAGMALLVLLRRAPLETTIRVRRPRAATGAAAPTALVRRRERAVALLVGGAVMLLLAWLSIWTCYGWRRAVLAPLAAGADSPVARAQLDETNGHIVEDWERALHLPDGTPRTGLLPAFLRMAAPTGLLPNAYLLGLATTLQYGGPRSSYLLGQCGQTGWWHYFLVAFAVKTPLATQLLLLAGLAALILRRSRARNSVLLAGLAIFVATYGAYMMNSRLNIGHRHLLPIYPAVYAVAGAAVTWLAQRAGRWLLAGGLLWLLMATLWIHPHYLSYFNELIGGPANGQRYLADSNIDWGQDLLRLADYARRNPGERIKLAYFGSAVPPRYLDCTALPSFFQFEPRADLTAGTYVVSATQLLGVYDVAVREGFWTDRTRQKYAEFGEIAAAPIPADDPPEARQRREQVKREYPDLRARRLLARLRSRPPNERIGWSLFVYRLSDGDVEELTRP